jgi:Ca2+/Na+ antiporter
LTKISPENNIIRERYARIGLKIGEKGSVGNGLLVPCTSRGSNMLNWNANKVKRLTGAEIWMFIVGRVLIAFGIGAICMREFPKVANVMAMPAIVLGIAVFAIAARGLVRAGTAQGESQS